MKKLLLFVASAACLGLAAWASRSSGARLADGSVAVNAGSPTHVGAIHPALSADGSQIAFSYQGAIWRASREGGTMTRLTEGAGFDLGPAWSPDGGLLAYVQAPRMAGGELRVMDPGTGRPIETPHSVQVLDTVSYSRLAFHPDGRLFGNLRVNGNDAGLALYDLKTGAAESVVKPLPRSARYALSGDGSRVAYTATLDVDGEQWGNDGPQSDIHLVEVGGGQPRMLTRFLSRVFDLCFAADGKSLFVVSDAGGAHNDLWHVPLDQPERGARRITRGQGDEDHPSVSRDGAWLVYTDNSQGATALVARHLPSGVDQPVRLDALDFRRPVGRVRMVTRDAGTAAGLTARVSLRDEGGKFHAPPGALYRVLDDQGHFYCANEARLDLPAGKYRLRAFRGPEYRPARIDFTVAGGSNQELEIELQRWTDAAAHGWHSGENHIHANYGYGHWLNSPPTMLEQCAGEDLRVCNFMVANSDTDGVFDRVYFRGGPDPISTSQTILAWNQEFRATLWGHMTLVNLSQLVEPIFTGFKGTTNPWDVPTNSDIADRAHLQQALVNYTHGAQNRDDPYAGAYTGKSIPVDVALGKIDTIDLNASYAGTVPLWYRLLNCGFRLPASAGTDTFLNRIRSRLPGADRVYVKLDGPTQYAGWIDGLRRGRSFVTNGPMLELEAAGLGPGETVRLGGPGAVRVRGRASSQFPLSTVELVMNGAVVAKGSLAEDRLSAVIDQPIDVPRGGWLSLRAKGPPHADHSGGELEAHTSPVYLEVGGRLAASKEDALYFLKWIDRLSLAVRLRDRIPSPQQRSAVEAQLEAARAVYLKIASP